MVSGIRKKISLVASILGAGLMLFGCSSTPLPTSADIGPKYQQLATDLGNALSSEYPATVWHPVQNQVTRLTKDDDGHCTLSIGTLRYDGYLPDTAGDWEHVMAVINPVLKDAGFAEITSTENIPGGWTGISSTDASGGEMRMAAKSYTNLTIHSAVSDPDCVT